jgi:hypothetical protein
MHVDDPRMSLSMGSMLVPLSFSYFFHCFDDVTSSIASSCVASSFILCSTYSYFLFLSSSSSLGSSTFIFLSYSTIVVSNTLVVVASLATSSSCILF